MTDPMKDGYWAAGLGLDGADDSDLEADAVVARPLSSIGRQRVGWLWPGRVPLGMLTLLIGDPGLGKSVFTLYLAGFVSRAGGDVLILSAEDHAGATIRPRAEAVGAKLERLHVVGIRREGIEEGPALPDDAEALDRLAREKAARLVIIDPLTAHLAEAVNSWRDQSVRRALAPLYRLAERQGCAVLVVAHLNKMRGADPLYRAGGSIGIPAAVRSALLLARDPDDPEGDRGSQRVLAHVKCNVGEQTESLACRIEAVPLNPEIVVPRFTVTGTSKTSAADLLDAPSADERTERDEAADFLRAELATGPRPVREVRKAARESGISDRTLDRAKAAVGVVAHRVGGAASAGHWEWSLSAPAVSAPPLYPPGGALSETRMDKGETTGAAPKDATDRDMAPLATPEEEAKAARLLGVELYDDRDRP
jgi:putative DNA primase/helicase